MVDFGFWFLAFGGLDLGERRGIVDLSLDVIVMGHRTVEEA
jgi:hypothetical protein